MTRGRLAFAGAGVALIALLGIGAAYAYFFSGLRSAPPPLALATPTPGASSSATPAAAGELAGTWKVASGSQAEWRVSEVFVGTTSPHNAVGRTSGVSGGLTVQPGASGLEASGLNFTADLTQLASVDTVAGRDVSQRDQLVRQSLSTRTFPTATFQSSQPVAIPAGLAAGQQVQVSVAGQLTIHGVTKDVTATVMVQMSGAQVQAAGTIPTDMGTFNITPPFAPFVTIDKTVTIGFLLNLSRS
ncbi:MAG TPA: YceI family protein [Candidatus Dormibacteraeota bacterium]